MKSIKSIDDDRFTAILLDVKEEVLKLFGDKLHQVILYGSYARGDQDSESDIDIMLVIDESEERLRECRDGIVDIMTDLSLKYDVLVSLTKVASARFNEYQDVLPFYRAVQDEGIEIFGKNAA